MLNLRGTPIWVGIQIGRKENRGCLNAISSRWFKLKRAHSFETYPLSRADCTSCGVPVFTSSKKSGVCAYAEAANRPVAATAMTIRFFFHTSDTDRTGPITHDLFYTEDLLALWGPHTSSLITVAIQDIDDVFHGMTQSFQTCSRIVQQLPLRLYLGLRTRNLGVNLL